MAMLKKYQGNMNVEWCNKTQVMKYLFKYMMKGPDFLKGHGPSDVKDVSGSSLQRTLFQESPPLFGSKGVLESPPRVGSEELAAIMSSKYRFIVSATTKRFEQDPMIPSYQVHRIDANYGKQPHSSTLRCSPGLALASSSKSDGNRLSTAREALSDAPILGNTSPSNIVVELADAPTCTNVDGSAMPPSAGKASGPSDVKVVTDSFMQMAMFHESPPHVAYEEVGASIVEDPNVSPVASTTTSINKRRRLPLHKALADGDPNKKS